MIKQLAAVKHMYSQKPHLLWVMSPSQRRGLEAKVKTMIPDGKPAPYPSQHWGDPSATSCFIRTGHASPTRAAVQKKQTEGWT